MRRGFWLACGLAWLALPCAAEAARPAGWWSFEGTGARVEDRSGNGLTGAAPGCARGPGREGQALKLDGAAGMTVPDSPLLDFHRGFTVDCWIQPDQDPGPARNIVSKPGEFLLRVDPAPAGGKISLFVCCEGGLEPRVSGPMPTAGQWYHVVASWDGRTARLWVNRSFFSVDRTGTCARTSAPLAVGGPIGGAAGFSGLMDEVQVYSAALPPNSVNRTMYGLAGPVPTRKRTKANFDFHSGLEGWQGDPDTGVGLRDGALCAVLASDESLLKAVGLDVDTAANPVCTVRMSASSGKRGVCIFAGDKMFKEVPFRLPADGAMHTYTLRCAQQGKWEGRIEAMALRVEGADKTGVRIESIRLGTTSDAPADVRLASVSPARRINALREAATVTAWVRNAGGTTANISTRLTVPPGVVVRDAPAKTIPSLGLDEEKELTWKISADAPAQGDLRVEVVCEGSPPVGMTRPVSFVADPDTASKEMARARVWLRSGYPRGMDFRHLFPQSVEFLEHNTALLVHLGADNMRAAQEFKRRYPDRLVLMQVNDEVNGLWGSWHCVPKEFAVKEHLTCDPLIFPMPEFRGYWLLGAGAALSKDMSAEAETCDLVVPETKWFTLSYYGRELLRDVLIYRRAGGRPDWTESEYASVVKVDPTAKTITIQRWPREAVGAWRAFRAGEAYVAPSVGSIYRLYTGGWIKTWVPNLTKFCPRDPKTDLDAVGWWARHFARLWHERIAASEPHPDGYEFDGLDEGLIGDCDNDGVVDGCEIGGINHWRLGLYDFFRELREGGLPRSRYAPLRIPDHKQSNLERGEEWKGLGDALILADCSNAWGPRCLRLLNGAENEEFPSFLGPQYFPTGLDLYRLWCQAAAPPACPYLQGRFVCDTYLDEDWLTTKGSDKFHGDGLVRLSIASACMGAGIYAYRSGTRRDILGILSFTERLEYPWDEYHAGREGRYNWLGLPLGEPVRLTDHLGPNLLPHDSWGEGWKMTAPDPHATVKGPIHPDVITGKPPLGLEVISIDTAGLPRAAPNKAARWATLLSPETTQPLDPNKEYCAEFWISADPGYDKRVADRYSSVYRWLNVLLQAEEKAGTEQQVLAGPKARYVTLTLRAPRPERCRVAFEAGAELGPLWVHGLRLREGCAEVFARRFEHGMALANGSAVSPYTFDLGQIGGGRSYRRFSGAQAPDVNNGLPAGPRVTLPAEDGLLLMAD